MEKKIFHFVFVTGIIVGLLAICELSMADDAICRWQFDSDVGATVIDTSGNNHNGTATNCIWSATEGCNRSLYFNGESSLAIVPTTSAFNLGGTFSFAAWIKPTGLIDSWGTLCSMGGNNFDITLYRPGRIKVYLDGSNIAESNRIVSMGSWTHVAIVLADGNLYFYINASLDKTVATTKTIPTMSDTDFLIGAWQGSSLDDWYLGYMDDVRLYNRALASCEPKAMMLECNLGAATLTKMTEFTFDNDSEGWTSEGDGYMEYHSTGGNPGGYLLGIDYALGDDWAFIAPWTGDLRSFIGKTLSFDNYGTNISYGGSIEIISGETKITFDFDAPTTEWTTITAPLTAEAFQTTTENFYAIMSNVSQFRFMCEYYSGPDQSGLDNVKILGVSDTTGALAGLFRNINGAGIAGIEITRLPGNITVTTDSCGLFDFGEVNIGGYTISANYNQTPSSKSVQVNAGQRSVVLFTVGDTASTPTPTSSAIANTPTPTYPNLTETPTQTVPSITKTPTIHTADPFAGKKYIVVDCDNIIEVKEVDINSKEVTNTFVLDNTKQVLDIERKENELIIVTRSKSNLIIVIFINLPSGSQDTIELGATECRVLGISAGNADLDGDGSINSKDLMLFEREWHHW